MPPPLYKSINQALQPVVMRCSLKCFLIDLISKYNKSEVFVMANIQKTLNDLRDEIIGKIGAYNAALKENDAAKLGLIEQELRETEQSYAEAKCV